MADSTATFSSWLVQVQLPEGRLNPEQLALLQAVFRFRQSQGADYYSTRLLSHFLLHCGCGLKVAAIARLLGLSRPTASRQQGLSSKEAIRQAHHRMDGRPYGKLLPRYAGPVAQFLFAHPRASRADILDFIDNTFGVRVSRIALFKFLKKYGLDQAQLVATPTEPGLSTPTLDLANVSSSATVSSLATVGSAPPVMTSDQRPATAPPPFSLHGRNSRVPSS
jgi:hypothetical protein